VKASKNEPGAREVVVVVVTVVLENSRTGASSERLVEVLEEVVVPAPRLTEVEFTHTIVPCGFIILMNTLVSPCGTGERLPDT